VLPIFTQPLDLLRGEDVFSLIKEQYPEGDALELKEALSGRGGAPDPWMTGQNSISDRARNGLLEELIAFANAHGGVLVLGVEESNDHPKRAKTLRPIPRCSELADRIRLQARDSIEPQLPVLSVAGVPTETDGSGVVICRVGQSRLAPHRLQQTRECYVRRADRTEKMTMREIQDLTLQRDRGMAALDAKFTARRTRWVGALGEHVSKLKSGRCIGVRLTLLPTTADLWIEPLFRNPRLGPIRGAYDLQVGTATHRLQAPGWGWSDRPILRGVRFWSGNGDDFLLTWELGTDGLVEASFLYSDGHARPGEEGNIFREWLLGLLVDALVTVSRVREVAGVPDAEYALDFELHGLGVSPSLAPWSSAYSGHGRHLIDSQPLLLPRMSIGGSADFPIVVRAVLRDLLNAAGMDLGDAPVVLPQVLDPG
jgi:hypothetical protein